MYGEVILTRDVTENGLRAGDVGTVVEKHAVPGMPEEGYSVEFFDMKAVAKTRGLTRADHDNDENLRLALTHLIQIVGEAARRVSAEFTESHSEIPCSGIIGMRHKVVHEPLNLASFF